MPRQESCRRCMLPAGMFHVRLDESGLCNYCRHWDENEALLLDFERHRPMLVTRLEKYVGRFHYDAAVGLSGGKDSAYVLDRLTAGYGANVLAVTFDNGFLTDAAWQNIAGITRASGVDHFTYKPDWDVYRAFYRATLQRLGDPCVACSVGGYVLSIRGCRDLKVPFFVHGRSPAQMFRHWYPGTRDPGIRILQHNLAEHSSSTLQRDYRAISLRMRLLLYGLVRDVRLRRRIFHELVGVGPRDGSVNPEFLAFFLFEPYDEKEILQHLAKLNAGYQRPANHTILGHGDCLIHDAAAYIYEQHHGVSRVLPDVATMLRRGEVTQDEAREMIAANTPDEEDVESSIAHMIERLEMSRDEFNAIVNRMKHKRNKLPFG